jgi:hypothetical protein
MEVGPDPSQEEGTAPETPQGQPPASESPEYFSDKFDPASLPPELQPGYQQMRNAFHQKTQALAEERRSLASPETIARAYANWSPEERAEFFDHAGLEYEQPEYDEDEYDEGYDDEEFRDPRVDVILAQQEAEEQLAMEHGFREAQYEVVNEDLDELEDKLGREFTQEEVDTIGDLAMSMLDEDGMPQVNAAYERIAGNYTALREAQADPKRRLRQPPVGGRPGDEKVDWNDPDARRRVLAAEIEAAEAEG